MSTSDRQRETHYEATVSGREGKSEARAWVDDGHRSKYGRNEAFKREREDSKPEREAGRKKSRSRSPWEEASPNGSRPLYSNALGGSGPDPQSRDRRAPSRGRDPANRERVEKRTRSEPLTREAGEIAEDQPRDPHRDTKRPRAEERTYRPPKQSGSSREAARGSSSVPRRYADTISPSRPKRRAQKEDRRTPNKAEQKPPPALSSAIPAEIREAALKAKAARDAQQAEAARQANAQLRGSDEEGELKQEPGERLSADGMPPRKHTPVVWVGAQAAVVERPLTPKKVAQTAAETAELELERFKQAQKAMEFDPDAPAALKASPTASGSGREDEGAVETTLTSLPPTSDDEGALQRGIRSRWADEEELEEPQLQLNGKTEQDAAEELAKLAALNAKEHEELATGRDTDTDSDIESVSEFQATRREISMLNACRRVDCYERLNRISEGTYGVVYRARDKETGVICALKRIKMEKEREGFPLTSIREINILLSFQHSNIVDVSEVVVGDSLDQIFMVMEFMEHDLKGLMDDMPKPFTVAETKNLMRQLLEGMAYLHGNWVLHRDLKTSNILYNNRGQLKICDFGLARQYGSPLRPYTHNVVTLYYRAIELLLGTEQYSTAIDIWSLGCIMVELLTKKVLFQGTSELDQIDKIFKVMGSPTEDNWPGFRKLPNVQKIKLKVQPKTLRDLLPAASKFDPNSGLTEAGFHLLEGMLSLDPKQRISAQAALDHTWFKEQPYPTDNTMMPTYPTSKDGSSRTSRQRLHRPASPAYGPQPAFPHFASRNADIGRLFSKK